MFKVKNSIFIFRQEMRPQQRFSHVSCSKSKIRFFKIFFLNWDAQTISSQNLQNFHFSVKKCDHRSDFHIFHAQSRKFDFNFSSRNATTAEILTFFMFKVKNSIFQDFLLKLRCSDNKQSEFTSFSIFRQEMRPHQRFSHVSCSKSKIRFFKIFF